MQKFILTLIVFFSASCSFFGGPDYDLSADSTGLSFDGIDDYIQIDANVIPDSGDFSIAHEEGTVAAYSSTSITLATTPSKVSTTSHATDDYYNDMIISIRYLNIRRINISIINCRIIYGMLYQSGTFHTCIRWYEHNCN